MKIGYQLYSSLDLCQGSEGLICTIKKIAAMGYDGVEFFGYEGIPADRMKELLAESGIEACNSHVQLERWQADAEGEFRYAKEAGIPWLTIPWVAPELRNAQGYSKIKNLITKLVKLGKEFGIGLLYHNHDFEFLKDEKGNYILDSFLEADPDIKLELDTFWAFHAGVDPVSYMKKVKQRLAMVHVKDYLTLPEDGADGKQELPSFAAIGTGTMDNISILGWAVKEGLPWVVVEQDNSRIDVLVSAELSVNYLKSF